LRRVLAEDVHANINLPPFSRLQWMDIAVIAEEHFLASEDDSCRLKTSGIG